MTAGLNFDVVAAILASSPHNQECHKISEMKKEYGPCSCNSDSISLDDVPFYLSMFV